MYAIFLGAVGTEERTGLAIVPEPFAREAVLVAAALLGFAIVDWVAFLIICRVVWRLGGATA